ncbi:MAG: DUF2339 domain-containing protein [Actinomycetota bacterium]|nr:DUF2339 domain-containing protein [Actinomycetota bacterium]
MSARNIEDSLVGTWFARLGVLAVLVGAAFGYRYAVDQRLIGPAARVSLGALTGAGFLVWGHWAQTRKWESFSHAVTGGGVAILYLSVLAALLQYDLIQPPTALVLLTAIAVLSAWLAVNYDSLPLAILGTLGAFMNPFLIASGDPDAPRALTYVVGVDFGIVVLASFKRWPSLNKLALVGSVAVFGAVATDATTFEGMSFATVLWLLFTIIPYVQVLRDNDHTADVVEASLLVMVGFLYFAAGMYYLEKFGYVAQGVFTMVISASYAAGALAAHRDERTRGSLSAVLAGLAVAFGVVAAPIIADGPVVQLVWSVEGSVLLWVGGRTGDGYAKLAAAGLILVGMLGAVEAVATHDPDRLLSSAGSATLVAHIVLLYLDGWIIATMPRVEEWEIALVPVLGIAANLLTLAWLSRELMFEIERRVAPARAYDVRQFAISALWGVYSAALLGVGVARRQPWIRFLALGLFGVTIAKMVTVDLWHLEVLQRTVAFVGLGALLLASSLIYNRFRDLIVGVAPGSQDKS